MTNIHTQSGVYCPKPEAQVDNPTGTGVNYIDDIFITSINERGDDRNGNGRKILQGKDCRLGGQPQLLEMSSTVLIDVAGALIEDGGGGCGKGSSNDAEHGDDAQFKV